MAAIVWVPTDENDTLTDALPLPSRPTEPRSLLVVLSKKSTEPVGVPLLELTLAKSAIVSPLCGELFDAEIDVLVLNDWTLMSVEPLDEVNGPLPE